MFEKRKKLKEIDKALRHLQQVNEFHLYQRDHFGRASGDTEFMNIHGLVAREARVDITRLQYEREMVRTGKPFSDLHDINSWVAQAPRSRRDGWPQSFETLPASAFSEVMELVKQRRQTEVKREQKDRLRSRYDYSDADEVRAIERRTGDYGTLTQMIVDKVRDKMYEAEDYEYLPSAILIPIAYKHSKDNPHNPDIDEVIASAKREMMSKPGYKPQYPSYEV
jgi:hypothetical protein